MKAVIRPLSLLLVWSAIGCSESPDTTGQSDARLSGVGLAADEPTIECLTPSNFETFALQQGQPSLTVDLTYATSVGAELQAGTYEIGVFVGSDEPLLTTDDIGATAVALGYGEHTVGLAILENGVPLEASTASCSVVLRVTKPCFDDGDCQDGDPCSTTSCGTGPGGEPQCVFGAPPYANCCSTDFECADGAVCDTANAVCVACQADADCGDDNVCTSDTCQNGSCVFAPIDGCCDCDAGASAAAQCDNGQFCVEASCNCGSNECEYAPKELPGGNVCCETGDDASCEDGDPCTNDACVGNACTSLPVLDGSTSCCEVDSDCNDGNACTADTCDVATTSCQHEPIEGDGCCTADDQCDDGDSLTWDACIYWQCVHTENFDYCELPPTSAVVVNEIMINPASAPDATAEWIELHNRTETPLDLSGWSVGELAAGGATVSLGGGDGPLVISPLGYLVLCRSEGALPNDACDYVYGQGFSLSNEDDSVVLYDIGGNIHDQVAYDGGPNFPNPVGASIALGNPLFDNDLGSSWRTSFAGIPGSSDKGTPGTQNIDVFEIFQLTQCNETPDDICTVDTCVDNTCTHIPVEGCCNVAADCVPPTACHVATCVDNGCAFTLLPADECCLSDGDCNDESVCTIDRCVANTCKYGKASEILGTQCCEQDADCPGSDSACVEVTCDLSLNQCTPAIVVGGEGCCSSTTWPEPALANQCDDSDPGTIDSCKDFLCLSYPDPTYCDAQPGEGGTNHCGLDGNPCTDESCDVDNKTCLFNPVPGCCVDDGDCFDGNPCTADSCNPTSGTCDFEPIFGCCFKSEEATDCDDGSSCTDDTCGSLQPLEGTPGEFWGRCRNVKNDPGCCSADVQCDDGNACTTDTCDLNTSACVFTPVVLPDGELCCDATAGAVSVQCDDGKACTTATCVNNVCEFQQAINSQGFACCDPSDPTPIAEQCDDGSVCTSDVCVFGWCRNLVTATSDCCEVDADCDDGNSCTSDTCAEVGGIKVCEYDTFDCDDGLFCNGLETCDSSLGCVTVPGTDPGLDDGVFCTVDACDEVAKTVTHTPDNSLCDNGQFCDGAETCDLDIGCVNGTAPNGDDGVACTQDVCDELSDTFLHNPNDAVCDDGKVCNGSETCDAASGCVPGEDAVDVDDGIPCTIDSCDDATQQVQHLPDNTLCNDGLLCTLDVCDVNSGCQNTLADGFCLIAGGCYAAGATNPLNGCEECNPAVATNGWSTKVAGVEICNGIDDDCDGATDEAANGAPLAQACANACGDPGNETCVSGIWTGCTAPVLVEACGDGVDNDCDGQTDAPGCDNTAPKVEGAEVEFSTTLGQATNLNVDNGDGTYTTQIVDLANPNQSGTVLAEAYGTSSTASGFDVVASAPLEIEVVSMRDTLYVDQPDARFALQARDVAGRPVAAGTTVTVTFTGANLSNATSGCTLDAQGRCVIFWTAPEAAFTLGGPVAVAFTVGSQPGPPASLTLVPAPGALELQTGQAGIELPQSPRFPNATFDVPVYVAVGSAIAGSYDVWVEFNQFMLQATAVKAGSCSAFGPPVSNLAVDANSTGVLKINAFNTSSAAPCASSDAVHVATLTFKVLPGLTPDDPTVSAAVSGTLQTLTDVNLVSLGSGDIQVVDAAGQSTQGQVNAWSAVVKGVLARVQDTQLLDWSSITGTPDSTPIQVTAYRRDYSFDDVSTDPATGFSNTSPAQVSVSPTGLVTANSTAGLATVAAQHQGSVSTVRLMVLTPESTSVSLSDGTIQRITGTDAAPDGPLYQRAQWTAAVSWTDGSATTWTQNMSDKFPSASQVVVPAVVDYDFVDGTLTGVVAGTYPVTLSTTAGVPVTNTEITIDTVAPVSCTGLEVVAPCDVELTSVTPASAPAALGTTEATATVTALLDAYEETCQVQVYAQFDDGNRMNVTDMVGLTVTSPNDGVLTATPGGLLTAKGPGTVAVSAEWAPGGAVICSGAAPVNVDLPDAVGLLVTPQTTSLALNATDPAALLKGLPISQQLTVTVIYADGSSQNFTNAPSTVYDAVFGDPSDLVNVTPNGLVLPTGTGPGQATVNVSVGLYPGLGSISVTVDVVTAAGIFGEIYEPYSPDNIRQVDHVFSFIEGTSTRQDGTWEAELQFSDGSSVDITDEASLIVQVVQPGTNFPVTNKLAFDKATRRVTALSDGTFDVQFFYGTSQWTIPNFVVEQQALSAAVLVPETAFLETTFSGEKDVGETTLRVYGVFNDGTRRRLYDSRFIPALLTFASSDSQTATVNQNGIATIRGNGAVVFTVGLNPALDSGAALSFPADIGMDCNLTPGCGDVDWGDEIGLAFKDRAPGETFTLQARINTCGDALGAFDLELTYDTQVLTATSVTPAGASQGAIFSPNWQSQPGTILANAILNLQAPAQSGANLPIMNVEFTTVKGGSGVSTMGGEVISMLNNQNSTIGFSTPRALIAGAGLLDPMCESQPFGDVDGNCVVDLADVRTLQGILSGAQETTDEARAALGLSHGSEPTAADLLRVYAEILPEQP